MKKLSFIYVLLVISILFALSPITIFAQNDKVLNVNVIVSDTTGKTLKDVAIYNSKQKLIGITDNFGTTTITAHLGDAVMFSHISYEQKTVKISDENMIVVLQAKTNMLPEAEIVENAPHLAYKNKEVWIVDYIVGNEGVTAITTTGKNSHLLHLSFEQDTLSIRQIDTKYESLFRDVFGNIHLVGPDSTYQVYSDGEKMHLLYGVMREKFDKTFAPIAALTDSILVTKQAFYYGQEWAFFKVNRNTLKTEFLCDIYGESIEMAKNWDRDNNRMLRLQSIDPSLFYNQVETPEYRSEVVDNIYKKLMLKELYVPVFNVNNHIYIFDFQKDAIYIYNNLGDYLDRTDITFHRGFRNSINKHWDNHIIYDDATKECYARFTQDGIVTLKKINLKTGNIDASYILDSHVFPENIQIYNGTVYYKFIDVRQVNGRDCRSLYKMQLK